MVRVEVVETSSYPWEGYIIAVIRYPQCLYNSIKKLPEWESFIKLAGPTGVEPAISSVTGRRTRPLYHEPLYFVVYRILRVNASRYLRFLTDRGGFFKIEIVP